MLDAMYVARDLLPLLRALKPEEQATVLDYLDAVPRERHAEEIAAASIERMIVSVVRRMRERGQI